jgi:predicted nuclease of restriction endonuclease-like (RecB) superfamily
MSEDKEFEKFNKAVKLALLLQSSLEIMDEMRGLKMYRHDIKNLMNNLEKKIERHLREALDEMGKGDEFIMMQIQRGIDSILEKTLEEIHNEGL